MYEYRLYSIFFLFFPLDATPSPTFLIHCEQRRIFFLVAVGFSHLIVCAVIEFHQLGFIVDARNGAAVAAFNCIATFQISFAHNGLS